MLDTVQQRLDQAVEDNAKAGAYRVTRDIFTDPEIFELEMKYSSALLHQRDRDEFCPGLSRDSDPPR